MKINIPWTQCAISTRALNKALQLRLRLTLKYDQYTVLSSSQAHHVLVWGLPAFLAHAANSSSNKLFWTNSEQFPDLWWFSQLQTTSLKHNKEQIYRSERNQTSDQLYFKDISTYTRNYTDPLDLKFGKWFFKNCSLFLNRIRPTYHHGRACRIVWWASEVTGKVGSF